MPALTNDEMDALLTGPTIARLAMTKPTGEPYLVPIWQHWDGEKSYVIPRGKAKFISYLKANANVALSVADDIEPTHDRVLIEGRADILEGPAVMQGRMLEIAEEMAFRYGGDPGLAYLNETRNYPRYLVQITPTRMTTWKGTWHQRYV